MADRKNKSRSTIIATLVSTRDTIYAAAYVDNDRTLNHEELSRVEALNSVIAYSSARKPSDAMAQLGLALEYVELSNAGCESRNTLLVADAALRSAHAAFGRAPGKTKARKKKAA